MSDNEGSGGSRAPAGAFGASRPPASDKPQAPKPKPAVSPTKRAAAAPPKAAAAPPKAAPNQAPHKGGPARGPSERPSQAAGDAPLPPRLKQPSRQPTLAGRDSAAPPPAGGPRHDSHKPTLIGRVSAPPSADDVPAEKSTLIGRTSAPPSTPADHESAEKSTLIGRTSAPPEQPPAAGAEPAAAAGGPPSTLVGGPVPHTVHEDMIARARSQRGSYPSPPSWDEVRESLAPAVDSSPPQPRPASVPPAAEPPAASPAPAASAGPAEDEHKPATRNPPPSEVTQLGIPLGGDREPAAPPAASATPSAPPEAYDDEIEEDIDLEELPDDDPPVGDDGMDINLQDDPLGAVGAPRVIPPAAAGAAVTPGLLEVAAPAAPTTGPPPPPPAAALHDAPVEHAPEPQSGSEPPGPTPSVVVAPSAPPSVRLAGGPAPAPLSMDDETQIEDGSSPVLGALAVAAMLMLLVGGWYVTRGGFTPTKPKVTVKALPAAPSEIAAPAKPAAPKPASPPPRAAPGGVTDSSPATATPVPPPARAGSVPKRKRTARRRPRADRHPPPTPPRAPEPSARPADPAPVVSVQKRAPVIAIKPTGSGRAPAAPKPEPVGDPSTWPDTPSRADVKRAFKSVHTQVLGCSGGKGGVADVDLTVLSNGRVSLAKVGGDYAGTPEGSCMARAMRQARFSPFKREKFRIIYPVAL